MALKDDIRILERRTHVALDAAHDYYEFSQRMWLTMNDLSQKGRKFRFDSKFTGSTLDETNLAAWSASHVSRNLGQYIVGRFVSILEDFIFGLLRLWLAAHPRALSKRQLPFMAILDAPDKSAIILDVVDRELNEVKYERLAEWFAFLNKLVKLDCPTADEIARMAELKATRDVLLHTAGVANAIYVQKAGTLARSADGEILDADPPYIESAYPFLLQVVADLGLAVASKA